ncbi:hypothetical protein F1559_003219 [Cyanidiococcus yangmingshanensis]|uniref:Uncharacterized protein n=1 Tax=Cyanidiococcus yangmingshanensis TaxID=2690220 RepID=A0A7J7IF93_9RHOD|nr:hypothetical protein F1559_003219 [Cyanidiococcus yangmingshanensis]
MGDSVNGCGADSGGCKLGLAGTHRAIELSEQRPCQAVNPTFEGQSRVSVAGDAAPLERCLSRTSFDSFYTSGLDGDLRRSSRKSSLVLSKGSLSNCGSSCLGSGLAMAEDAAGASRFAQQSPSFRGRPRGSNTLSDAEESVLRKLLAPGKNCPSLRRFVQQVKTLDCALDGQFQQIDGCCPQGWTFADAVAGFTACVETGREWSWQSQLVSWLVDLGVTLGLSPSVVEYAFFIMRRVFMEDIESLKDRSGFVVWDEAKPSALEDRLLSGATRCSLETLQHIGGAALHLAASRFGTPSEVLTEALLEILAVDRHRLEHFEAMLRQQFQWPKKPVGLDSYIVRVCEFLRERRHELHRNANRSDLGESTGQLVEGDRLLIDACLRMLHQSRTVATRIYLTMEPKGKQAPTPPSRLDTGLGIHMDSPSLEVAKSSWGSRFGKNGLENDDGTKDAIHQRWRSAIHPRYFCTALLLLIGQILQNLDRGEGETPLGTNGSEQDSCSVEQEHGSQSAGEQFSNVQPISWPEVDEGTEYQSPCATLNQLIAVLLPTDEFGLRQVWRCLAALQETDLRDMLEAARRGATSQPLAVAQSAYSEQVEALGNGQSQTAPNSLDMPTHWIANADVNTGACRATDVESDEWMIRRFRRRISGLNPSS